MTAPARSCGRPLLAKRHLAKMGVCSVLIAVLPTGAGAAPEADPPPPQVEIRVSSDAAADGAGARSEWATGNPLQAIPVESLSTTRDRPLFSPTRRPPPTTAAVGPPPPAGPAAPAPPARPRLALIGTVVSTTGSFGIFMDEGSRQVLRLRTGEVHAGWTLRSVNARDVVMFAGTESAVLALPVPAKGGPLPPQRAAEGPFAAARVGAVPAARQVVVPKRFKLSPSDVDSSH